MNKLIGQIQSFISHWEKANRFTLYEKGIAFAPHLQTSIFHKIGRIIKYQSIDHRLLILFFFWI